MKMNFKRLIFVVIILLLVLEAIVIFQQKSQIGKLTDSLPYLFKGEQIKHFELVNSTGDAVTGEKLRNRRYSLLFVFNTPCSICNENIPYWKKIKKLVGNTIPAYGIVLDDYRGMVNFSEEANLNFDVCAPVEVDAFKESFRLKLNLAQTIITKGNEVEFLKMGDLSQGEFLLTIQKLEMIMEELK